MAEGCPHTTASPSLTPPEMNTQLCSPWTSIFMEMGRTCKQISKQDSYRLSTTKEIKQNSRIKGNWEGDTLV